MKKEVKTLQVILTTKGRNTGKKHSVSLRAVMYNEKIYFSRHRPDSDWFKNALKNPDVKIQLEDKCYQGRATLVKDQDLAKMISQLKYPSQARANEPRVVLEVTLYE